MSDITDAVLREIRSQRSFREAAVCGGKAKDFVEYKVNCAVIETLNAVEEYIIVKSNEQEDSDE